jgi:excisionase family DNA binding protein
MVQATNFLALPSSRTSDLARLDRLEACLRDLDHGGAVALVQQASLEGVELESLVTGLLAPALVEVGRQWAADEVEPAVALAAAAIVRSCLPRASSPPGSTVADGRTVAVCCPPGEEHEIPAEMVSELLRQRGWQALHLGAGATPEQMPSFLAAQRPQALLISATTPCGLAGAARMVAVAQGVGVPVLVGGAAFDGDGSRASQIGAAGWARSAADAVALLEAWSVNPPALAPHPLPAEFVLFEAWLPEIRRAALDVAGHNRGGDDRDSAAAAYDQLDLVLRHVEATVLVGDKSLFIDFLSVRRSYCEAHHLALGSLDETLQAVACALPAEMPSTRDLLQAGRAHLAGTGRLITGPTVGAATSSPTRATFHSTPARPEPTVDRAGRVFTDLLFVAAKSCQVPLVLISLVQPDGRWSTLRHIPAGSAASRRDQVGEELLFALVAAQADVTEITNLADHPQLAGAAMARCPNGFRFAYGVPLRATPRGAVLGVLCLLDRRTRVFSSRESQAIAAVARQVTAQLARRRPAEAPATAKDTPALLSHYGEGRRLRSHEVAVLFDVTDRTVINWAASNRLPSVRTVGGHLRFRHDHVLALLAGRPITD